MANYRLLSAIRAMILLWVRAANKGLPFEIMPSGWPDADKNGGIFLKPIKRFFAKPYRWTAVFAACLALVSAYILLDAFVIPRAQTPVVVVDTAVDAVAPAPPAEPVITDSSYEDGSIRISIETMRVHDTDIYMADIQLADASLLRTALAQDTFGRNIKATTSSIAADHQAIFAINGDNYGARDAGFVLRNGVLYRDLARSTADDDALLVGYDGTFQIIEEAQADASVFEDAWQVLSFGPALLIDGALAVDGTSEVAYSPHSNVENPRTAIGQIGPLHYIVIVTDGRTGDSKGLTLLELAAFLQELGCETAYNLDGGGSSTMVFMGELVNQPTSGRSIKEREINDIVYIGYQ